MPQSQKDLTPLERLILLQLELNPRQTAHELMGKCGAATRNHFVRTLRTLRMAGLVTVEADGTGDDKVGVWSLPEVL